MKYRDTLGRTFLPGQIADIPTGNLVWVDAVNGIDALARRGRMTVPFKTLGAAKEAAQGGDTVIVMPGSYQLQSGEHLAKHQVNWHFMNGASVFGGSGTSALFPVSSGNIVVTGAGRFESVSNVIQVSGGTLVFEGYDLYGGGACVRVESQNWNTA